MWINFCFNLLSLNEQEISMKSNLYKRVLIFSFFFLCVFIYGHQEVSAYCSDPNGCLTITDMLNTQGDYGNVNSSSNPSYDNSPYIYYSYEEPEPEYGYGTHNIEEVIGYLDGDINTSGSCSVTNDTHDGGIIQCGPNFVSGHNIYIRMRVSGNPYAYVWQGPRFFYTQASPPPPPAPVYGCMDPSATNYNSSATADDGSCTYICTAGPSGYTKCADENGTCSFSGNADVAYGCSGSYNIHYNVANSTSCNNSTFGDPIPGTAKACFQKAYVPPPPAPVYGCTDPSANNYNSSATVNQGCTYDVYGCMDPSANNYNPSATVNQGCTYTQLYNDASIVTYSVPSSMTTGQSYTVSVTMKNTGTKTWTTGGAYNLGAYDNVWGGARQSVGGDVAPGSNKTFSWTVVAPSSAGTYNFTWRMVQDGVEWFGSQLSVPVTVSAPPPAPVYGCTDPSANNYNSSATVNQGCTYDVYGCMDPSANNYNSSATVNQGCTYTQLYNDSSLVTYSVPNPMVVGQSYAVSVTMKNTGTKTWAVAGEGNAGDYNLGAYDNVWGWARQSVGGNISPGSNKTFSWTVVAPSSAGTYSFVWKMVAEWQEWFGYQLSIPITVNAAPVYGCTDPTASNYDPSATVNQGCTYPPPFDYTLSQPANVSVTKGGIDQYGQTSVTRTLTSGSTESVTLSVSGVPTGVGYSVSNNGCTPNCSSTILFTVHPTASAGSYSITVTGSPLGHSKTFTLTIVASSAIISTCTPSSATPDINTSVTWSATASGGTPPYTYTWTGTNLPTSPAPSTQSFSITYSTIGNKTAQISIRDSIGNTGVCLPVGTLNVQFDPKFEEI